MIVIFNGPPGSGKDEAASYFCDRGFRHLSFKHVLYEETCKHFKVTKTWFMDGYHDRAQKEEPKSALMGMSRREAMIHVSENIIKPKYGPAYFGEQVASEIDPDQNYAISDGGFVEELRPIINKVGEQSIRLVQLVRDGCSYSSDSRRYFNGDLMYEYAAGFTKGFDEQYVLPERFNIVTFRIYNNGSLEAFHQNLKDVHAVIKRHG